MWIMSVWVTYNDNKDEYNRQQHNEGIKAGGITGNSTPVILMLEG
jgi:hypothetical protein